MSMFWVTYCESFFRPPRPHTGDPYGQLFRHRSKNKMGDIRDLERQLDLEAESKNQGGQQSSGVQRGDAGKTREEVLAEREERKKAKLAAKAARKATAAANKEAKQAKGGQKGKGNTLKEQENRRKSSRQGSSRPGSRHGSEMEPEEDVGNRKGRRGSVVQGMPQDGEGREGSKRKGSVMESKKSHTVMLQFDDPKKYAKFAKKGVVQRTRIQKQVPLFSHLPQYERESSLSLQVGFSNEELHPAIVRLGLKYAEGTISGSNARCVALLHAFKQFIREYKTPPAKVLSLDMHSVIKPLVRFLIDCRPQSISMGNALRYLKMQIAR